MDVGEGDYEAEENKFMLPKLTGPHTLKHSLPRALVRAYSVVGEDGSSHSSSK